MIRDILFRALLPFWILLGAALLTFFAVYQVDPFWAASAAMIAAFFVVGLMAFYAMWYGVPPMPTKHKDQADILSLIPEDATHIYELGSGWGHLADALGKAHPNKAITGYEISPVPYWVGYAQKLISNRKNVRYIRGNFFTADLANADVIVCYLFPEILEKLLPKLQADLKPGTLILSNHFQIAGLTPEKTTGSIHVYRA